MLDVRCATEHFASAIHGVNSKVDQITASLKSSSCGKYARIEAQQHVTHQLAEVDLMTDSSDILLNISFKRVLQGRSALPSLDWTKGRV